MHIVPIRCCFHIGKFDIGSRLMFLVISEIIRFESSLRSLASLIAFSIIVRKFQINRPRISVYSVFSAVFALLFVLEFLADQLKLYYS